MSRRVEVGDVLDIIVTDIPVPMVEALIDVASLWVDENLAASCTRASAAMLAQIEKFLAAHLISTQDPELVSSSMENVSETYQRDGQVNDFLKTAIALDPCGIVRTSWLKDKQRFKFRVGTRYVDESTDP